MKNIFTFGIFLSLLFGIGNNVSGAQFTANTGIKPGAWNSRLTWYPAGTDTTVVANFPLPTYLDDVTIPAGDSIYLGATTFCGNINLSGTLCMYNGSLYANGDITVNTGGILSLKSNVYCKNLYNAGKVWAYNTNYNSAKILGIGFTNTGTTATTIASTDSITIVNDGIIGGLRSDAAAGKNGCGIWVTYSNRAKALNIKHSANVTSGFTFNVGGIYPAWNPSGLVASPLLRVFFHYKTEILFPDLTEPVLLLQEILYL